MKINKLFLTIEILSTGGVLLAVYLLWQQFFQPSFRPCSINVFINCDAIISGGVAKTLGIPTPLFGLVGYLTILIAAIFHYKKIVLGMSFCGLLFCLWIGYQELFKLHVICPICILCQIIMIAVFSLAVIVNKRIK